MNTHVIAFPGDGEEPTAPWVWRGTVPSLDGLRGISIALVVVHHAVMAWGWSGSGIAGFVGVDIFFVISGFLITLLLLRENRRTGTVSLRNFYFRRACRILPAYVVFLLVLLALQPDGVPLSPRNWLALLTYTVNFTGGPWEISHVWSLCVEEHFYLLWPLVVLLLGPRRAWIAAVVCILVTPLIRLAVVGLAPGSLDLIKSTPSRMDTIAAGCCLAYLATNPSTFRRLQFSPKKSALLATALVLVLLASKVLLNRVGDSYLVIYPSINAIALAVLAWLCVNHGDTIFGRILSSAPLVGLGLLAYSIYIWHKLFITPNSSCWACEWPVNLAMSGLAALASYFLIEKPFLRLKDRLGRTRRSEPGVCAAENGPPT